MRRDTKGIPAPEINCVPFVGEVFDQFIEQYYYGYNNAFLPMRKALDIEPYVWFTPDRIYDRRDDEVFVLVNDNELIGSVACFGNEVDELFVSEKYLGKGYGKKLLIWAMDHIAKEGFSEITLTVAEWNQKAVKMYLDEGFKITKTEKRN